jgi:hypothetical protein
VLKYSRDFFWFRFSNKLPRLWKTMPIPRRVRAIESVSCKIESSLTLIDKNKVSINKSVKTFTKNEENLSPIVTSAAVIITDQCINKHSEDIIGNLK